MAKCTGFHISLVELVFYLCYCLIKTANNLFYCSEIKVVSLDALLPTILSFIEGFVGENSKGVVNISDHIFYFNSFVDYGIIHLL